MKNTSVERVLFLIDGMDSPYAGTESQLVKLIKGLSDRGVEVLLLSMARSEYLESAEAPCKVEILGTTRLMSFSTWIRMFRCALLYRRRGFRLVHIFFNDSALLGPPIFRLLGFKTITSRRDMGIWYTPIKLKWLQFNRWFTSAYVTNSNAVKDYTCQQEKAKPEQAEVIYNGYIPQDRPSEPVELPFGPDAFIFGIVANLRPVKRIADAIRALAIIISDFPQARLVLVGNQDPRDPSDFRRLSSDLGLDPYIFFAGRQTNASSWISKFDAGLLCSESEGFSNAIIEYLQQGKPVICSDVGGNAEIVSEGVNGYLYAKGDIDALAEKMALLLKDTELLAKLESQTISSVTSRFSLESMVDKHLDLYGELVRLK